MPMTHTMYSYWAELTETMTDTSLVPTAIERQLILAQLLREDPPLSPRELLPVIDMLNKMQRNLPDTDRTQYPTGRVFVRDPAR